MAHAVAWLLLTPNPALMPALLLPPQNPGTGGGPILAKGGSEELYKTELCRFLVVRRPLMHVTLQSGCLKEARNLFKLTAVAKKKR